MLVDDPLLPAAAHLTGDLAVSVLRPAVRLEGSELIDCRPCQVQYRVGSDVVVRYRADVRRRDGVRRIDTLLAAASIHELQGTVPVEAEADDGTALRASVWRWPFDPVLVGLPDAVTPGAVDRVLAGIVEGPLRVEEVVYRPTERAVIRVEGADRTVYLKVVAPSTTPALLHRHERLAAGGVPVPEVLAADPARGWFALEALEGPTLRDLLKHRPIVDRQLPSPDHLMELHGAIAASNLHDVRGPRSRLDDAAGHAAMLGKILPHRYDRIATLATRIADRTTRRAVPAVPIHGDLHEGQLVVRDGAVVGLLDVDDAGPGDPLDDAATMLGHLAFRAVSTPDDALDRYRARLWREFAGSADPSALAVAVAAVLVGLATGPFRVQLENWIATTTRVLDAADAWLERSDDG